MENGTIDITDLVELMRTTFVSWAGIYAMGVVVTIPGFAWLALPIINSIFKSIVEWVAGILSKSVVMEAFFINTAIRKSSQASDFTSMVYRKNNLPSNVSDDEYEKAERDEIEAFNRFVNLSN